MAKKAYADMTVAELKEEAAKHNIEGRSSMKHDELVAALESAGPPEDADEAPATRAPRDNRRILKGVQFPEGGTIRTYSGDTTEELDALEKVMTAEQCERLKEAGALEGDWSPSGEPMAPMARSRADKAAKGQ